MISLTTRGFIRICIQYSNIEDFIVLNIDVAFSSDFLVYTS